MVSFNHLHMLCFILLNLSALDRIHQWSKRRGGGHCFLFHFPVFAFSPCFVACFTYVYIFYLFLCMHLYLYICVCTYVCTHTHPIYTYIPWLLAVWCVYIFTYMCVCLCTHSNGPGSWQAQTVWSGVWLTCFFSPSCISCEHDRTQLKSPPLGLQVAPHLLAPLHPHPQTSLKEEKTPQRSRLLRVQTVSPRKHPRPLGETIALLWQVGGDLNWHGIRKTRLSRALFNFKVIRTVCL